MLDCGTQVKIGKQSILTTAGKLFSHSGARASTLESNRVHIGLWLSHHCTALRLPLLKDMPQFSTAKQTVFQRSARNCEWVETLQQCKRSRKNKRFVLLGSPCQESCFCSPFQGEMCKLSLYHSILPTGGSGRDGDGEEQKLEAAWTSYCVSINVT